MQGQPHEVDHLLLIIIIFLSRDVCFYPSIKARHLKDISHQL